MDSILALHQRLRETESNFRVDDILVWHSEHLEVPVFACCIYFVVVFWLPGVLEVRKVEFKLKWPMIFWNLLLAIFSMCGASRTVPALLSGLREKGFEGSICSDGSWFLNGTSGFWVMLFIYSKIPELVDTFFLVLKRRPVILLHWFHHCTVLLYCWHAYHIKTGPGLWFATMNYCVHAIMYSYYAAMAARLGKMLTAIAPFITALQILQMLGGMIVIVTAGRRLLEDGQCAADPANLKLGFAMYCSYFILFFMLFWNKYVNCPCTDKASRASKKDDGNPKMVCGVDINQTDSAGRFNEVTKKLSGKKEK